MNNNLYFRGYTHTLQMVSQELPLPMEEVNAKPHILKNVRYTQRGVLYPINVNKFAGRDIDSLSEMYSLLDEIRQDLLIDKWELDRQDIAIDTGVSFDELYKLNKMFVSLFGVYQNKTNLMAINDAVTLKKRALTCTDRKFELYIYDKNAESGGKYPYSRCEFRFKLLDSKSRDKIFKRLYDTLDALPNLVEALNRVKIETLYQKWLEESNPNCRNTPVRSLPEFFRRYGDDIFTIEIARGLHDRIANGSYKNWINKYRRRGNNIHFIKKNELKAYCKAIKKAVQKYENQRPLRGSFLNENFEVKAA